MASIHRVTSDFVRQLEGFSLATAEILYRIPDHPLLLQTYIWQDYDRAPDFPVLNRFLTFWEKIWMVGFMRSKWCMNALSERGISPLPAVWSISTEIALCFLWSFMPITIWSRQSHRYQLARERIRSPHLGNPDQPDGGTGSNPF